MSFDWKPSRYFPIPDLLVKSIRVTFAATPIRFDEDRTRLTPGREESPRNLNALFDVPAPLSQSAGRECKSPQYLACSLSPKITLNPMCVLDHLQGVDIFRRVCSLEQRSWEGSVCSQKLWVIPKAWGVDALR